MQSLSLEALQKIRATNLHPSVGKSTHFKKPIVVANASMQWITDVSGKKYLDFFGGIVTVGVGHCHP
jgi:alanine-glyoxylate transaminase/(R)-3-amino-2-methylpropionate-pyruvate transaminase